VLGVKHDKRSAELLHLYEEIQASCFALWIAPGKVILCERPAACEIVDGRLVGMAWGLDADKAIVGQLPPSDPMAVEISCAELLAEIDKTLQDAGVWIGGRLDSIKQLIEMAKPSWGAGDEYVASLREQWGEINELVANSIGRTPEKSLVHDVKRLVEDYARIRVAWERAKVYLDDLASSQLTPDWIVDMVNGALGIREPDTSGGEYEGEDEPA
jgi:hypothetical protein